MILLIIISAMTVYLFYDLFNSCSEQSNDKSDLELYKPPPQATLVKYKFDKSDVEDLTNIQGHFQKTLSKVILVNEVEKKFENPSRRGSVQPPSRKYSLLQDIHESVHLFNGSYSVQDIMSELQEERSSQRSTGRRMSTRSVVTEGMKKNSLASISTGFALSVDSVDCVDPTHIEILRAIADIEEDAQQLEKDIEYFSGGTNSLRFFELNEKLIRCNIALSDIVSSSEKHRERKKEVQKYIASLQNMLKSRS